MPNWCDNSLEVKGPKKEVGRFEFLVNVPVDEASSISILQTLLPLPKEYTTTMEDGTSVFTDQGYWDTIEYWGTKWADCETQLIHKTANKLIYDFQTAWSPPLVGIQKISKQFPTLTFTLYYCEPGMCFRGKGVVKNGEIIEDNYDEDWSMDEQMLTEAKLTEDEREVAFDWWCEMSGDEVYNFKVSSQDITKRLIRDILKMRKRKEVK